MSKHLPECDCYGRSHGECALCICDRLRACEKRVLDAARDAVMALTTDLALSDQDTVVYRADALAAIDALREKA